MQEYLELSQVSGDRELERELERAWVGGLWKFAKPERLKVDSFGNGISYVMCKANDIYLLWDSA